MNRSAQPAEQDRWASIRAGLVSSVPYSIVGFVIAMTFGILARQADFSIAQTIVFSAVIFAGSAQFTVVAIIASGGTAAAAISAAALMTSRFLPMGIAIGPSLPGGPWCRAAQAQAIIDASWAPANRGDGTFDRWFLFASTTSQYWTWVFGTAAGVFGGDLLGDASRLGLDALFPTFFLALLIGELRNRTALVVALCGGLLALALVPVVPAGLPVLLASLVALWGLRRPKAVAP